jgi:hypothetical protein
MTNDVAIFVSPTGNNDNPGTMEAPVVDIWVAQGAAELAGAMRRIVLSAGTHGPPSGSVTADLIGGRDPDNGWLPSTQISTINADPLGLELAPGSVAVQVSSNDIDFRTGTLLAGAVATLVSARSASSRLVDVKALVNIAPSAVSARVLGGELDALVVQASDVVVNRVRVLDGVSIEAGGSLALTNSFVQAESLAVITCSSCVALTIAHSHLRNGAQDGTFVGASTSMLLTVVGSVLTQPTPVNTQLFELEAGSNVVAMNNVMPVSPPIAFSDNTSVPDVDALNACAFSGCVAAGGNTEGALALVGGGLELPLGAGASVAQDQSVDAAAQGAPTSVAVDAQGDCRYQDGSADIGPDEITP